MLSPAEWNFDELLKHSNQAEIRFCYRYEFGREAFNHASLEAHATVSLGESVVLFQNPDLYTEDFFFYTHYFSVFQHGIWLKAPYFDLPAEFRTTLAEEEKYRLSSMLDPRCNVDRGPFERVELVIPVNASNAYLRGCFAAYLEVNRPQEEPAQNSTEKVLPKKGGEALVRQWKAKLRFLAALRLLRQYSIDQAKAETKNVLGRPLYSSAPSWSAAKRRANEVIKSLQGNLRPTLELLSTAPKGVTQVFYSGSGKITYS